MSIEIKIQKNLGDFKLNIEMKSENNRIGILGASGCGKSMTLKSLAGVEEIDKGYIAVNGKVLYDSSEKVNLKPQKRRIGYLFQNYALFPTQTVEKNIMAGLIGRKKDQKRRVEQMIELFQLEGLEDRFPGELSGGQQQRAALARIMAYEPDVILLDEPFSALDGFLKDRLQQEMSEILEKYQGIVILVSHNRDEIYRFCEDLLIMDEGEVVCFGKTREIFKNPVKKVAARLTGCKNIADIRKKDAHSYEIPDWQVSLEGSTDSLEDCRSIGYRAHEFIPVWGERKENCIPFRMSSKAELPFEIRYFLKSAGKNNICWIVQREEWDILEKKGMPDFLQIDMRKLLYLK